MENEMMCVPFSWTPVEKSDYEKFGIIDTQEAHPVFAWFVKNENAQSVVSMYNYGQDKKFIDNIFASVEQIKDDEEFIAQHGMQTVFSEIVTLGKRKAYVLVSKVGGEGVLCFDVFFYKDNKNYNLHTIVEEKEISSFDDIKDVELLSSILSVVEGV
ncbi:MAG: hypothetical protein IJA69_01380 [Clostridia bacterium]|nr:hypothetical protein [Clostridia bacterium]